LRRRNLFGYWVFVLKRNARRALGAGMGVIDSSCGIILLPLVFVGPAETVQWQR
jgi:hypothetical protein